MLIHILHRLKFQVLRISFRPYPILLYNCFHFSESPLATGHMLTQGRNVHIALYQPGFPLNSLFQPFPVGCAPGGDRCHHLTESCPAVCLGLYFLSQDVLLQFLLLPPIGLWGLGAPEDAAIRVQTEIGRSRSSRLLSSSSAWTISASLSHTYPPIPELFP